MKSYAYLSVNDNRPLDVWGKPIGPRYEKKDWDQLSQEEMMADFEWKSDVLAAFGDEIECDTFYQDYLFHELYDGELDGNYKVLLTEYDAEDGNKMHKVDVEDIMDYLHLNDVALSPCLFYSNWRRKKLLNYIGAFVLDIDKLRPAQLQRFFTLFDDGRLLTPSFIANSGSGVHFYYVLDKMLPCDVGRNEANNLIAEEIYKCLYDDVIKKENWKDAQRHWIGQDYRVVNSRTKLNQVSQIFKVGEVYAIEQLISHYGIDIDRKKRYATKSMIEYANNIAQELKIDHPDYSSYSATFEFIKENKDDAFLARKARREKRALKQKAGKKKAKKPQTWYKKTLSYMMDHTQPGFRFSALKALAIIAYKEKVSRETFFADIDALSANWETRDWKGDDFNTRNLEAIARLYDNAAQYANTSSETLEEWLGYEFKRIGAKRNGRKREDHIKFMNLIRDELNGNKNWRNKNGAPTKQQIVLEWRELHPDGRKIDCIRETGLSKPTVYKWWNGEVDNG
ncbi:MAG: hypothetical protein II253_07970 [Lachnospiraceae bacterium]|nr:hypothetical protein [Lachnospiraceae bacterium]